jgi:uncharacterized membrane protein
MVFMMNSFNLWRVVASLGLLGLIFLIIVWNGWLTPVQQVPRWLELLLLLTPLMLLVRGVFHGWGTVYVYGILVSLLYATLGAWYAVAPPEQAYGYGLLGFSVLLYAGSFMGAKVLGKMSKANTEGDAT